jgi:pimeloyl-ACP methyl ester carboxylesterase
VVDVEQRRHDGAQVTPDQPVRSVAVASVGGVRNEVPGAPSLALLALEMRAWPELALYFASWPLLFAQRHGDGHSVLVLPPFGATDAYTGPMRVLLRALGYSTHGWGLGQNLGPTSAILDGVPARLAELAERSERPVTVIGWSAGGILGREAARRNPDATRQVITLGSPFRLLLDHRYRTHAAFFYRLAERWHAPPSESIRASAYNAPLLEVPATAIYSRTDGVASWEWCLEDEGPRAENIEVYGSHCGLGHNPAALVAIADRLAQPDGEWKPFTPPGALRHLYPG